MTTGKWVLVLAVLAVPALAQPPRNFFPWWDSPMAKDLNLTADQQQQIRQTVKEFRSKLIDLRGAVEKAEGELEDQFNESYLDQRRAGESIERLAAARADLTRAFSQMSLRLRSVLTPEQWQELRKRSPDRRGAGGQVPMRNRPQRMDEQGQPPRGGPPPVR